METQSCHKEEAANKESSPSTTSRRFSEDLSVVTPDVSQSSFDVKDFVQVRKIERAPNDLLTALDASASADALDVVEHDLLGAASEEAQDYRRELFRGKNLLIIQGGYKGKAYIYDRLKELGARITIMDGDDTIWRRVADEGRIDEFIYWDPVESDKNKDTFASAMKILSNREDKFDGVTTYWEDAVYVAARIAEALGVPLNPVDACYQARNKLRTRAAMAKANLPVPRFACVKTAADLPAAVKHVGMPAVLKPAYGAASMGVVRVATLEAAVKAYEKIEPDMNATADAIWAQGTEMILEELYVGDECDVDVLMCEGRVVYAKTSDNWACLEPWFQEVGTNCPSLLKSNVQKELEELAEDTLHALGFKGGCFHVELMYTRDGARIIEVNARMGGVSVSEVNLVAWGVCLIEEHALVACGIPIQPIVPEYPLEFIAECAINAPYSGTLNTDKWLDFADDITHKINYFKFEGEQIQGPEDGIPDWIAEVLVTSKNSMEEACDIVKRIVQSAPVPITPKNGSEVKPFFFPTDKHPFVVEY